MLRGFYRNIRSQPTGKKPRMNNTIKGASSAQGLTKLNSVIFETSRNLREQRHLKIGKLMKTRTKSSEDFTECVIRKVMIISIQRPVRVDFLLRPGRRILYKAIQDLVFDLIWSCKIICKFLRNRRLWSSYIKSYHKIPAGFSGDSSSHFYIPNFPKTYKILLMVL